MYTGGSYYYGGIEPMDQADLVVQVLLLPLGLPSSLIHWTIHDLVIERQQRKKRSRVQRDKFINIIAVVDIIGKLIFRDGRNREGAR